MHASATTVRDQPCIRIEADGASALIALHGAHVLSWIPADGRERLFLSERAAFDGQTAIRGGIPVIFPQFSERGLLPKHGFVRIRPWTFAGLDQDDAVFALDGDGSEPAWPHPFRARLRIAMTATTFAATLDMSPGYGYSGIVIAMLAGLNPLGVVVAAVFVAGMLVGADSMSRTVGVPTYIADVIVAVSLIAILVTSLLAQYRCRRS